MKQQFLKHWSQQGERKQSESLRRPPLGAGRELPGHSRWTGKQKAGWPCRAEGPGLGGQEAKAARVRGRMLEESLPKSQLQKVGLEPRTQGCSGRICEGTNWSRWRIHVKGSETKTPQQTCKTGDNFSSHQAEWKKLADGSHVTDSSLLLKKQPESRWGAAGEGSSTAAAVAEVAAVAGIQSPARNLPCAMGADKTNKTKKSLFPPPPPTPPPPPPRKT